MKTSTHCHKTLSNETMGQPLESGKLVQGSLR